MIKLSVQWWPLAYARISFASTPSRVASSSTVCGRHDERGRQEGVDRRGGRRRWFKLSLQFSRRRRRCAIAIYRLLSAGRRAAIIRRTQVRIHLMIIIDHLQQQRGREVRSARDGSDIQCLASVCLVVPIDYLILKRTIFFPQST